MPDPERCIDGIVATDAAIEGGLYSEQAALLIRDSARDGYSLVVPAYFWYELEAILYHRVGFPIDQGGISNEKADETIVWLRQILKTDIDKTCLRRARDIGLEFSQEYMFDSIYAAFAECRKCEYWTGSKQFWVDVRESLPFVRFVGDYAP